MQALDTRNTVAKSNLKEFSLITYFEIVFTRYLWTMKTIWLSKYFAATLKPMRKFRNFAHLQNKVILTQMWSKLCEIQTMTDLGIERARLFKLSFDMESSIIFLIGTYRSFNCGSII